MEKYYCDRCCLLYNNKEICPVCGLIVEKKIIIEVQKNSFSFKKDME